MTATQLLCPEVHACVCTEATFPTGCSLPTPGRGGDTNTGPSWGDPGRPLVIKVGLRTLQCPYSTLQRLCRSLPRFDPPYSLSFSQSQVSNAVRRASNPPAPSPCSLTGVFCHRTLPHLILSLPVLQRTLAQIFSLGPHICSFLYLVKHLLAVCHVSSAVLSTAWA